MLRSSLETTAPKNFTRKSLSSTFHFFHQKSQNYQSKIFLSLTLLTLLIAHQSLFRNFQIFGSNCFPPSHFSLPFSLLSLLRLHFPSLLPPLSPPFFFLFCPPLSSHPLFFPPFVIISSTS